MRYNSKDGPKKPPVVLGSNKMFVDKSPFGDESLMAKGVKTQFTEAGRVFPLTPQSVREGETITGLL